MRSGPCALPSIFCWREIQVCSCLRIVHRPLGYRRRQEQRAPSLYHRRSTAHRDHYLVRFFQDRDFFQSGLATNHSRVVSARPDLATLSSVLLVPLVFSPCPDANGGIDLLAIGSSECSSLGLPRVN